MVNENITNYCDFKVDVTRLFGMPEGNAKVILMVIGALGSILLKLYNFPNQLWIPYLLGDIQNHFGHCACLE